MTHSHTQLETHGNGNPSKGQSRSLSNCVTWLLILLVLALHWLGMHALVAWLGGEASIANAQPPSALRNPPIAESAIDDGWRRTAKGWEYKMSESPEATHQTTFPKLRSSAMQIWPAAAAACMMLVIIGLPDPKGRE